MQTTRRTLHVLRPHSTFFLSGQSTVQCTILCIEAINCTVISTVNRTRRLSTVPCIKAVVLPSMGLTSFHVCGATQGDLLQLKCRGGGLLRKTCLLQQSCYTPRAVTLLSQCKSVHQTSCIFCNPNDTHGCTNFYRLHLDCPPNMYLVFKENVLTHQRLKQKNDSRTLIELFF